MRILQIIPAYLPATRYGGPIFSVHGLAAALVRRGHQVEVFTTNVDGPGVSPVETSTAVDIDGVQVYYYPVTSPRKLYRSPEMGRALRARLRGFDVVHLQSLFLWPPVVAAREAERAGVPYVVSPRGMLVKDLIRRRSRLVKSAWIRLFDRRMLERAAGIHVTSELEHREAKKFGFRLPRAFVIPNGTDVAQNVSPEAKGDQTELLFLGRINWKKGLDRLIKAMQFIPDAQLTIAGNDEEGYQALLEEMVRGCAVEERVHFVGPVHGQAKAELLSRCTVLVLPSHNENFGNVVLEAMAHGCPVAVTAEVGAGEIASRDGAGVIVSGEPERLGREITELIGDPPRLAAMGEAGKRAVRASYTWDAVAEHMEDAYRSLVERRKPIGSATPR